MKHKINRWVLRLGRYAQRPWYFPALASIAAIDLFLIVIPTDGFMVTTTLFEPKRWWKLAIVFALGTAIGTVALAHVIHVFGETILSNQLHTWETSQGWAQALRWMDRYGPWAVFLMALGPFPIHPAIALAGVTRMELGTVFVSAFGGRLIKNFILTWLAQNMPFALQKVRSVRKEMKDIKKAIHHQ